MLCELHPFHILQYEDTESPAFLWIPIISCKASQIMASSSREVRVYKGSCHCAATKFSVKAPTITSASSCNCSICTKHGSLFIYPTDRDFKFERVGPMTEYRFGKKTLGHKVSPIDGKPYTKAFVCSFRPMTTPAESSQFCSECGCLVMVTKGKRKEIAALNVSSRFF